MLLVLVIAGDIETNLRPQQKFLCGKCRKSVYWNQKGIQCDGCDRWHHINCIGISVSDYLGLSESSAPWHCAVCAATTPATTLASPTPGKAMPSASLSPSATYCIVDQSTSNNCCSSLNITHLNVRSLIGHLDQVIDFAVRTSPDILALSETWLDCDIDDSEFSIPGF